MNSVVWAVDKALKPKKLNPILTEK